MAKALPQQKLPGMTRRSFIAAGSAATISVALPRPLRAQQTSIVSTVFGGFFEAAYRKHVVEPFEKKHNARVILKYGTSSEWVTNSLLNRAQPEIDVIFLAYPDSIRAVNEGLGMTLSAKDIPNIANLHSVWYDSYNKQAVGLDYASWASHIAPIRAERRRLRGLICSSRNTRAKSSFRTSPPPAAFKRWS